MKMFFKYSWLFLLIIFTSTPIFAVEETIKNNEEVIQEVVLPEDTKLPTRDLNNDGVIDDKDVLIDDTEENFFMFKLLGDPIDRDENSLHSKIQKALKAEVTRTDYSNYLLKDILTVDYDRGPIDRIQFYGKYRGNMSFNFFDSDLDSEYDVTSIDLGMMGQMNPQYKSDFKLQFKLTPTSDRSFFQNLISDAYIVNQAIPNHQIFVGNSRAQVGVEGGMSTTYVPFVLRSQIARTFGNTRAFGVKVNGKYSLIDYSFAGTSSDRYFKEFFPGAEFTGWVNLKPLGLTKGKYGKLVVGGGINAGKNHNNYTVSGAYIGYNYKNFMANAEYSVADGYNGKVLSTNKAEGFYTTLGYKITPKLQLVGRFDQFDPNKDVSDDLRREYSAGLNYFIIGQGMRILLNYVYCDNENKENSHRLILGTQLLL
ncbi:hypothetical protein IJZ97_03745 [bacterium]|nr:hypothetical protein [bacterium]